MCFMEVTLSVGCELEPFELPAPPVLPLDSEPPDEVVPLISTVWPTCSVSLEVSPVSCQVLPEESVRV